MVKIKIKKLKENAVIPSYAHPGDAGLDFYSTESVVLKPGERRVISTGIAIELPEGYVSLIWGKGGLAAKKGIAILGGVIEHTYRGDYGVVALNTSSEDFVVSEGDKIAQLLIQPIATAEIEVVGELSESVRGDGAYGSTGN
jgi:dUTP pyrophosphatase